jgi:hypothetical protein
MKRPLALVVLLAAALAVSGAAGAKGPSKVTITGPGLAHPIVLAGNAEGNLGSRFGRLVQASGWFALVFSQSPDPTTPTRPAGALGPAYLAVYVVPTGGSTSVRIRQELYPYATGGAIAHVRPGQPIFGGGTHGGWYRGGPALRRALIPLGLPARAPAT